MNFEILNVSEKAVFDNSIVYAEKHTHQPYAANSLNNNDEIRIPIQQQDVYTLPWLSFLYFEGKVITSGGTEEATRTRFVNNGVALLFDEIRYEIGGAVIDRVRFAGLTSTMKGYLSFNTNESIRLQNAGWSPTEESTIIDSSGNFNVIIPLRILLGFCEDFKKIILNVRQELVLIRSNSDVNAVINSDKTKDVKVELHKLFWKMPHISVADAERLKLIDCVARNRELDIPFRSWELHEYPMLQTTQRQTWAVKTATQLEKPRFVIIGFQTNRKNQLDKDYSRFDHCNLTNIKLYLNSEMFPYDNLNVNFDNNQYAILYEMFAQFRESYYEKESEPIFTPSTFKSIAPLAAIDCTRQNEILKSAPVDMRLEFETNKNIPENTTAYCLILYDKLARYNPLTNVVRIL